MGVLRLRSLPSCSVGPSAGWSRALTLAEFADAILFQTTFDYLGPSIDQAIAVPYGEAGLTFDVYGAGAGSDAALSGRGAYAKMFVAAPAGSVLTLRVPGTGQASGGPGWPGGGQGGQALTNWGEGGGGAAMILKYPYATPGDIVAVVPGGGGASLASAGNARGGDAAMAGGDTGAYNGWAPAQPVPPLPGGVGATPSAGGAGGYNGGAGGTAGSSLQGGTGGTARTIGLGGAGAGGGGAGYFGGGGGGATIQVNWYGAGGGGGSGYVDPALVTVLASTKGARLGNGQIVNTGRRLAWPVPVNLASFAYTGAQQTWVVPGGVTSVVVAQRGAAGSGGLGGKGLYLRYRLAVTPGETLYVYVGGSGTTFNGGGGSRWVPGGGASDVRQGGTAVANRVAVSGGGGGNGSGSSNVPGGDGGLFSARGAGTAFNTVIGTRSTWTANGTSYGTPAVGEVGGDGGQSGYSVAFDGGGGGGGHRGGGGGQAVGSSNTSGGGGGGSSWWDAAKCSEIEFAEGSNAGNGSIQIRW